ncbi:MAG: hypothetical protein ACRDK8_15700, partial [Solirubrobacteraceae bacterium]
MRRPLSLLAAVAAILLLPASALARTSRVVPFKTIEGVPLGLTPYQVTHRLGRPSHTVRDFGKVADYDYHRHHHSV